MKNLSLDEIRELAPAVFTEYPAPHLSSKYGFINTLDAINIMAQEGFSVVSARQDAQRSRPRVYQRHALVFQHSDWDQAQASGEVTPRMLLINSHNGKTSMTARLGMYRFICANGMVIGNDHMAEVIRHTKSLADQLIERIQRAARTAGQVYKSIEHWQATELSPGKAHTFAKEAAKLRFGEKRAEGYEADMLLEVRRPQDEGNDLWHVFNRVQEATTNLAITGKTALGRSVTSRPLLGITENTVFNEQLWRLAESFAETS